MKASFKDNKVLGGLLVGLALSLISYNVSAQQICVDFDNFSAGTMGTLDLGSVSVSSNSSSHAAMIFDANSPTGGDSDLGTPNADFGGPGVGTGGAAGTAGENSVALGKVLILSQNNNASNPNDYSGGGTFTFTFDEIVKVANLSLLDIDNGDDWEVKFYDEYNFLITSQTYSGLGNNSFTERTFNISGVKTMKVILEGSGAIAKVCYQSMDSDGDGIADDLEDYPNDPDRAFNSYFPCCGMGSLAFEDLWPASGDYDFNDLIVDYRFQTVTNSNNYAVEVFATFEVRAFGAGYHNGFGFQLPDNSVAANDITVTGFSVNGNVVTLNGNGLEAGQSKPTIIAYEDAFELMSYPGSGIGVNTDPSAGYVTPAVITLKLSFAPNTYTPADISIANFNPFIFVDGIRGKEVHLPDYTPTSLVDNSYFNTVNDDSNPSNGRYYKSANNLPWGINLLQSFEYVVEKEEVTNGYYHFFDWAQSEGTIYNNWYFNLPGYKNPAVIY